MALRKILNFISSNIIFYRLFHCAITVSGSLQLKLFIYLLALATAYIQFNTPVELIRRGDDQGWSTVVKLLQKCVCKMSL